MMIDSAASSPTTRTAALVVNGRFRSQRVTGVQRYASEIVSRLTREVDVLTPRSGKGAAGHLWEQTALPWNCKGRLLWNPNASGPLGYHRQVVTFHDLFPVENPEWYSKSYAQWYGITMRRLAKQAVHLIAVSEYTKSRIVQIFGRSPEDITVIHNGCHVRGRASQDAIDAAASTLKLPSRRYVLSLSSLERRKNVGTLLEAWARIHHLLPQDLWLVLAGPAADASVFGEQQQRTDLPRVFFTGYVPEQSLSGLYSGASLFVFPSLCEGFGLPLLEAMSSGVRCLSSNTSSLPEVGGAAVEYMEPENADDVARAMLEMLREHSTPRIYEASLEQASRFTWGAAASKTLKVLETANALRRPNPVRVPARIPAQ